MGRWARNTLCTRWTARWERLAGEKGSGGLVVVVFVMLGEEGEGES